MTNAQIKLVSSWVFGVLIIAIFSIFHEWIMEHWQTVKIPLLALILIGSFFMKKWTTHKVSSLQLNEIFNKHPWMKIYLALYGMVLVVGINYVFLNDIKLIEVIGFFELFSAIILLILPALIMKSKEAYINAGKEI